MNLESLYACCEEDIKKGHSQNRDYSIRYGKNCKASSDVDEGKKWSKKQQRESGLTDRKPL